MELFLAPECLPFAVSAIILVGLTGLELVSLLIGFSFGEMLNKAWPDDHGGISGLLSWLNYGGVPVLILLMLILGMFAINGFVLQAILNAFWGPLPALAASIPAFLFAIPEVRFASGLVARIVPRDETYVVDLSDFVGRTAEVTVGPLDQGLPGRIRAKDRHGNWHVFRAKAAPNETPIAIGAQVLIVDRASDIFIVIVAPSDLQTQPTASTELP